MKGFSKSFQSKSDQNNIKSLESCDKLSKSNTFYTESILVEEGVRKE